MFSYEAATTSGGGEERKRVWRKTEIEQKPSSPLK